MTTDLIYTTYEAAARLQVHCTSVINWIEQGEIKAYKTPGGHRRIKGRELNKFIKKYNI